MQYLRCMIAIILMFRLLIVVASCQTFDLISAQRFRLNLKDIMLELDGTNSKY